jgi:hypothetical protein
MQTRSMCGVGPYKQFWTRGVTDGIRSINPCCMCLWRGVPRGGPRHLPHICGELPRASAFKGVNVTP